MNEASCIFECISSNPENRAIFTADTITISILIVHFITLQMMLSLSLPLALYFILPREIMYRFMYRISSTYTPRMKSPMELHLSVIMIIVFYLLLMLFVTGADTLIIWVVTIFLLKFSWLLVYSIFVCHICGCHSNFISTTERRDRVEGIHGNIPAASSSSRYWQWSLL